MGTERKKPPSKSSGTVPKDTCSHSNRLQKKGGSDGAQSEVIGVLLLLSISITAIGVILLFGQPVITGAEGDVQFDRMENEFSLLDASMSSSALGASESQSVSLNVEGGRLETNPDASWMSVVYENATGSTEELANITMGNLRYVQDGKTLAYEGGGVWRSNENENFTSMISSPEFHYRGSTLTLPSYDIESELVVSGARNSLRVESADDPRLLFPDEDLDNPLQEGNVTITIKSEYYRGWESFFRGRTTGAIQDVNGDEQKVAFSLEVPTELQLTAGIMYVDSARRKNAPGPTGVPYSDASEIEVDLPSSETIVNPEVDKCIPSPAPKCEKLTSVPDGSALDENKMYYVNGDYTMNDNYHAPDANVTILINGDLEYNSNLFAVGGNSNSEAVKVYVDGDIDAQSAEINTGSTSVGSTTGSGDASRFVTYANGEIPGDSGSNGFGNTEYTGVIYAPSTNHGSPACSGSDKIAGSANIQGTVIGDSVCVQGATDISYDSSLSFLDLSPDVSLIRYLHITENDIRLSS